MDWVEFTGETLTEAQDRALDALGVGRDEAEFEVVEEPSKRLLGLVKREARVRARVRPTAVRPKQDRRRRNAKRGSKREGGDKTSKGGSKSRAAATASDDGAGAKQADRNGTQRRNDRNAQNGQHGRGSRDRKSGGSSASPAPGRDAAAASNSQQKEQQMSDEQTPTVSPDEVRDAAVVFMKGLTDAFGVEATTGAQVDGTDIDVTTTGSELGLLVGSGGRTLNAVQDLARVAAQRRLGDHETRLRVDVGGYREKRRAALEQFTRSIADQVMESGTPKALEPMASADRKVVHDVLNEIDGVTSRSQGDDPRRQVVIEPA